MKKNILAVCDREQEFACHLTDYLSLLTAKDGFPFEVQVFTSPDKLKQFCKDSRVSFLLITESVYRSETDWEADQILILEECGEGPPGLDTVNKYQSMDNIVRRIMEIAADRGILPPATRSQRLGNVQLIGIYTPVRRCLQTTFSFTLGQLLARRHKVLYLNFECYSGLARMLQREFRTDLSDLIYFLHNGDGRFPYRLEGMVQKVNGLDFIPPVFSCMDLQRVEKEEWLQLFEELELTGRYEYILLDLSEAIQGLFDILKLCTRVYTITRDDGFAAAKQEQYEELLRCLDCEEILEKTRKCRLPLFRQLPVGLENMTRGELAVLVQELIREDWKEE